MQVTETLSEGLRRAFTIELPATELAAKRDEKLARLAKTITLPGFRPGKVPPNVVRQRYGASIDGEVREDAIESAIRTLLQERGLRPVAEPRVGVTSAGGSAELAFTVEMELLPDIPMPVFSEIQLTRMKAQPDESAIERTLGEIAQRQRTTTPVEEDRGAARGEILTVNFVGRVDGEAFAGGTGNDVRLEVCGPGFIPGFTEGVEGLKPGEAREVAVTFPDDYQAKELAGKAAVFEITATKLEQAVTPDIDEDLAKRMGFDGLEKLREAVHGQMQTEYDGLARMKVKRQLLDALSGLATFNPPDSMVSTEFDAIWRRIEADRNADKLDEEDKGKDEATLRAEYRAIAERRVRLGLLLSEVGRINGIQVSQEEMTRAMRAEAARYQGQEREVIEFFRKNPRAAETLRGPLLEEKVVDFILDQAKIEERSATPDELVAEDEAEAA